MTATDMPDETAEAHSSPDASRDPKALLKTAEEKILELAAENEALKADLDSVLQAQALETEQMVQMSEQLWKLEEALMSTTEEKDAALLLLQSLKTNVERIKSYAEETLTSVKERKASRLTMAAQVYEIKSLVDTLGLEKK